MTPRGEPGRLPGHDFEVAVVGGGQAGLSISWYLSRHGVRHVVLERNRVGYEWRERRWDSFCLVTPNWQCQLPGHSYRGSDPDGFMERGEIVEYIESYVAATKPPVVEEVSVERLEATPGGGFELRTSAGVVRAAQVVVATGPYHLPVVPPLAEGLAERCFSLHSSDYRSPDALPAGAVLVVGSGQSGCQIAEDLHLAGRQVHLSVGSAPRVARRYRARDVVAWLDEMGYYKTTVEHHPLGAGVRRNVNHYVTGRDGGHDLDLRAFALEGMQLYGRLVDAGENKLCFAADLGDRLDHADAVSESIKDSIDAYIAGSDVSAPGEDRYVALWEPPPGPRTLDVVEAGVSSVIWATGFRPDFGWVGAEVFDESGQPRHQRGVSPVDGLYFLGLPWLNTWGSARFSGIAADAEFIAQAIVARARPTASRLRLSA